MDIYSCIGLGNDAPVPNAQQNTTTPELPTLVTRLKEQDMYTLVRLRGGSVYPTYTIKGRKERMVGSRLAIEAESAAEFSRQLRTCSIGAFPEDATDKALEVVY